MGDENMMNKKGSLALRNIMFMLLIFSSVLMLGSLFVLNMGDEYENTGMVSDYTGTGSIGSVGDNLYGNVNSSIASMKPNVEEGAGSFGAITGAIGGVGSVLKTIILAPVYIGTSISSLSAALNVPTAVRNIMGNLIAGLLYIIIFFVILSALSRGGTKL